ncbi:MAG: DNA polymerase III subunit delta [Treponema sp.]|jgi:DNA polymerase-3 subunit delta|nr:DNA polymerase III subunit delta [Treponema sp.]
MTNSYKAGTSTGQSVRLWILLGLEIGEKEASAREIAEKFAAGAFVEKTTYYAGDTPVPQMVSAMRNGSLFAARRIFFIKNAEAIKRKEDLDLLASYMASPQEDTVLILMSEENSISKVLEKAAPPASKRVFYELSDSRKTDWVGAFFRNKGFRIGTGGIQTILELVENNTQALERECSRLTLFLEKQKEISAGDVEKWLSHTRDESAFTLFSRIAAGDLSRSLESLRTLFGAKESPQAILAGLAWCFRKLRDYLTLEESGVRDDWEYKKIGVSSPQAKRDYAAAARRYNLEGTDSCLALTAEYDALVRSASSFPEQILMDQYLYKIHRLAVSGQPGAPYER